MSWKGALAAFFWASLVRIALLQHATWSINSICHAFGDEAFEVRDKSRNVAWPDAGRLAAKQTGSAGRKLVSTAN